MCLDLGMFFLAGGSTALGRRLPNCGGKAQGEDSADAAWAGRAAAGRTC